MAVSKTLVIAQTGGPTAVINSTLAGIIDEARCWPEIEEVIGCENGFHGLFSRRLVRLSGLTSGQLNSLRNTPGIFLGSSRILLTPDHFNQILSRLAELRTGYFLQIGGNGTMFAAGSIAGKAREAGLKMQIIGVPKTVDNDIVGMDHTPGFGSAARYVVQAMLDVGLDLWSMRTFEQVRIIEVMGRNVGWLAAAAGLAKGDGNGAPHLIYLPEVPFDENEFIEDVDKVVQQLGYAAVVVGEGIRDKHNNSIGNMPFADVEFGSQVFGGAAAYLANKVSRALKIRARAQDLGMVQRCFSPVRSEVDEQEAYLTGRAAVKAAVAGLGGNMVSISGITTPADPEFFTLPLSEVGGKEKKVPGEFYDQRIKQVTKEFTAWLKPLIGPWNPDYLRLENLSGYVPLANHVTEAYV